ncbi:MAG: hypothetical protein LBN32_04240, partial [Helicobacteraceae bacterium]|nr:hypothetical protein [Helicobacteraceae bacterium]
MSLRMVSLSTGGQTQQQSSTMAQVSNTRSTPIVIATTPTTSSTISKTANTHRMMIVTPAQTDQQSHHLSIGG